MSRGTRKRRTVSMRHLSRKDAKDTERVEAAAAVASTWRKAGFEITFPEKQLTNRMVVETRNDFITTVIWPVLNDALVDLSMQNRIRQFGRTNHVWAVGMRLTDELLDERERYHGGELRIMNFAEFEHEVERLRISNLAKAPKTRAKTNLRTGVGKAIVANGPQLKTAITTSIVLIEERIEVLNHTRPNAEESKAKKEDEIQRLTVIRGQLETIRDYPEMIATGAVKEGTAVKTVKSLSEGISEYWSKHTDAICDKLLTFGLFSSLVLVGQLSGVMPEITFGLAGTMAYGKPVVDALKAMKGWFKAGR